MIRVQQCVFDQQAEVDALTKGRTDIGAVVTFTGKVRSDDGLTGLMLEHYPGMTEQALQRIEAEAQSRWDLQASLIIHRFGDLKPGEDIVLVATASAHREAAFQAASFLMDYLKTDAPFWKKETGPKGARWVDAKRSDTDARSRWFDD